MFRIETVRPTSAAVDFDATRKLFGMYSQFLEAATSCGTHLPKLDDEIATHPNPLPSLREAGVPAVALLEAAYKD